MLIQTLRKANVKMRLIVPGFYWGNVYERKWGRNHKKLGELSDWDVDLIPNKRARKGRLGVGESTLHCCMVSGRFGEASRGLLKPKSEDKGASCLPEGGPCFLQAAHSQ